MPALLEVDRLVKHFPLKGSRALVRAVNGVSFRVERGQTLGLIGESGSGKTTVGRCILKLIEPTSGEITFDGTPTRALSQERFRPLRRRVQMVFQDPFRSLNPRMSVRETLREPLVLHRIGSRREPPLLGRPTATASFRIRPPPARRVLRPRPSFAG